MRKECKDLRVAFLINKLTPHSLPLVNSLSSKVQELIVITSTPLEKNANWTTDVEEKFHIVQQKNLSLRRVRHHPQGYAQQMDIHVPYDTLLQLMIRRPDAVISLEFGMRTLQAMVYRILKPASRLIVWAPLSERTEQGRGKLRESLRRIILKKADAVLVNGNSGVRYLRRLGADSRKIFIVPCITNIDFFQSIAPTRPLEDTFRLLYVGQLIELKGLLPFVNTLIRWVEAHPAKKVEFALAGEGPIRQKLVELSLPNNLILSFLGQIHYLDLPPVYAKAGIFVFPTLGDEWGLVVNEAMMTGLPVLGSIYGQAMEELVKDGVNGWIFKPDDPQSLYRALDLIMTASYADLEAMRIQARRAALKLSPEYAAQQIAASLISVFKP